MNKDSKIYVAGHTGLAGSAIVRELEGRGYNNVIVRTHDELDLTQGIDCDLLDDAYIFMCAAHAGGIKEAIDNPVDMLHDNLRIQNWVIPYAGERKAKKLLFLGSSCIYPVDAPQPYREEQLGTGKTDENWSYAIAKIVGIELCRSMYTQYGCNFITAIPCNLYGFNDSFDLDKSHVIPALIRKLHTAKINNESSAEVWGDGHVRREFLHTSDFARNCVTLMEECDYDDLYNGVINMGSGYDISIIDLAMMMRDVVGYRGQVKFNGEMAGVRSKLLDCTRMNDLGLHAKKSLFDGLTEVYAEYQETHCMQGMRGYID